MAEGEARHSSFAVCSCSGSILHTLKTMFLQVWGAGLSTELAGCGGGMLTPFLPGVIQREQGEGGLAQITLVEGKRTEVK